MLLFQLKTSNACTAPAYLRCPPVSVRRRFHPSESQYSPPCSYKQLSLFQYVCRRPADASCPRHSTGTSPLDPWSTDGNRPRHGKPPHTPRLLVPAIPDRASLPEQPRPLPVPSTAPDRAPAPYPVRHPPTTCAPHANPRIPWRPSPG